MRYHVNVFLYDDEFNDEFITHSRGKFETSRCIKIVSHESTKAY